MPGYCAADRMQEHLGERVWMKGIMNTSKLVNVKKSSDKNNTKPSPMSFATFEDETGVFECVLFPNIHRRYGLALCSDCIKQIYGRVTESWNSLSLEVETVI
jgi:DNA polymerase III alpha subunit